jgi:hypothetical protein
VDTENIQSVSWISIFGRPHGEDFRKGDLRGSHLYSKLSCQNGAVTFQWLILSTWAKLMGMHLGLMLTEINALALGVDGAEGCMDRDFGCHIDSYQMLPTEARRSGRHA